MQLRIVKPLFDVLDVPRDRLLVAGDARLVVPQTMLDAIEAAEGRG